MVLIDGKQLQQQESLRQFIQISIVDNTHHFIELPNLYETLKKDFIFVTKSTNTLELFNDLVKRMNKKTNRNLPFKKENYFFIHRNERLPDKIVEICEEEKVDMSFYYGKIIIEFR